MKSVAAGITGALLAIAIRFAQGEPLPLVEEANAIHSCQDLPAEDMELVGTLYVEAPIACASARVVHVKTDALVRSKASVEMTNLHFVVYPTTTLTIEAGDGIHLNRSEASVRPLFVVKGSVTIDVGGWDPDSMEGQVFHREDHNRVVDLGDQGRVVCSQKMGYNKNTFIAFKLTDEVEVREEQVPVATSSKPPVPPEGISSESNPPGIERAQHGGRVVDATMPSNKNTGGHKHSTSGHPPSHHNSMYESDTYTERAGGEAAEFEDSIWDAFSSDLVNAEPGEFDERETLNGSAVLRGGQGELKYHVDDRSMQKLFSADGKKAIWPGEDGSIIFGYGRIDIPVSLPGAEESAEPFFLKTEVLVPPWSRKIARVRRTRKEIEQDEQMNEGGRAADDPAARPTMSPSEGTNKDADGKDKRKAGLMGWFGFGRRKKSRDVDVQIAHAGEIAMDIDERGCVRTTVDGVCVLRKSGRHKREFWNRFPWRRRPSKDVELRVTDDGIEVTRGAKTLWGYSLDLESLD